jgi:hypothetical protein
MPIRLNLPRTAACLGALEVAAAYHSPALRNHGIRSYLWAADLGRTRGLAVDDELLFVSAVLHDIALEAEFDNRTLSFEHAGGHIARVFAAGAGWSRARGQRAGEVIVRHMWDEVDPAIDPEGFLLCVATGLDISGRNPAWWSPEFRGAVVEAYPRLDLVSAFATCFTSQAEHKPTSSPAEALASGLAARLTSNPLDSQAPFV